jgi:hypothetical protein
MKIYCCCLAVWLLTSCSVEPGQKITIKNETGLDITLLEFDTQGGVDAKFPLIVKHKSSVSFNSPKYEGAGFLLDYKGNVYRGGTYTGGYGEYTLLFSENSTNDIVCTLIANFLGKNENATVALYKPKTQQITVENETESDVLLLLLERIDTDVKFPLLVESKSDFTTERYDFKSTYFEFQYKGHKYWGDPEYWGNSNNVDISTLETYILRFFENDSGAIACDVFSGLEKIGSAKVEKMN